MINEGRISSSLIITTSTFKRISSSVIYPEIWRCGVSCRICGCECGGCASLKQMIHLHGETIASPEGDAASSAGDMVSPTGDLLESPNFGIFRKSLKLFDPLNILARKWRIDLLISQQWVKDKKLDKIVANLYLQNSMSNIFENRASNFNTS